MIRIIDNTLMAPYDYLDCSKDLYRFCELLFTIGVDAIELPIKIVHRMDSLPSGNYILNVSSEEEAEEHPGFYRYISNHDVRMEPSVLDLQVNDIREIIHLKNYQHKKEVRIVGLDDLLCHSYEKIMKEITKCLPNTSIIFCPENTYACASALALHWLMEYRGSATTSFAGCKNNAATEEVIMALRLSVRHKPNRDLTVLPELTGIFERFSGKRIGNRKAIIGKNIFKVEAGIHVDGLHKNPVTYEAYSPISVGGKSELVIGKHSGSRAIKLKLEQLGLPIPPDEILECLLDSVKFVCSLNHKSLNDEEFIKLLREVIRGERSKIYC